MSTEKQHTCKVLSAFLFRLSYEVGPGAEPLAAALQGFAVELERGEPRLLSLFNLCYETSGRPPRG